MTLILLVRTSPNIYYCFVNPALLYVKNLKVLFFFRKEIKLEVKVGLIKFANVLHQAYLFTNSA